MRTAVRRLLIVLAVISVSGGVYWKWRRAAEGVAQSADLSLLGDQSLVSIACDDGGAFLLAKSKPDPVAVRKVGIDRALAARQSAIVHVPLHGAPQRYELARGDVGYLALGPDGSLLALHGAGGNPAGRMARGQISPDRGLSWSGMAVPEGTVGFAMTDQLRGYSWSSERVYRTEDGGVTWRGLDLGVWLVERGNASVAPGERGQLFVALRSKVSVHTHSLSLGPVAGIFRINPDLEATLIATWEEDAVEGMALGDGDELWVALQPVAARGCRLVRLSGDSTERGEQVVWSSGTGTARPQVSGGLLLLDFLDHHEPAGFFSRWPRHALVSGDKGRTWTEYDLTRDGVRLVCLAPAGIWFVSELNKRATYRPVKGP